jgi:hypothetical protein
MTKTPFAGRPIHRQGGALFIAAEGQAQVRVRIKGVAIGEVAEIELGEAVKIDLEKMPFVWTKRSPRLSDPQAFRELRTMAAAAAHGMQERFGWWRGKHPSLREQIREDAEADHGAAEVAARKTGSRTLGQAVR